MTDAINPPAIYGALVAIQSEMGKVAKTGRGPATQGSYPFLPVDEIVARLGPLLSEHAVAVIPNQREADQATYRFPKVSLEGKPIQDGRPDAVQLITRLHYDFTFVAAEDGSSVTASAFGESIDTGDKGIRRAATAAFKEILLRTLSIVSGEDDPDAFDPNDQPAQVVREDRGAQARNKAAAPKAERAPRAPRAPRGAAAETPAEAEPVIEAGPAPTREEQSPAEQRAADWTPDPEDVAAAEQEQARAAEAKPAAESPEERRARVAAANEARKAAKAAKDAEAAAAPEPEAEPEPEVATPVAREPQAPVAKPEPETAADKRYESVMDIRRAILAAVSERGLDRDYVNALGDGKTGKPRGQWFANLNDLHIVLKAIENGEVAGEEPEAEAGF